MTASIAWIEIGVYVADGSVYRYEQRDSDLAREALRNLNPTQVLTETTLTVAGDFHTTTFPTASVTRLELFMDGPPGWSFGHNLSDIIWMKEQDFREKLRQHQGDESMRREQPRRVGSEYVEYDELELVSGERLYLQVHAITGPRAVRARAISRLLESPSIPVRYPDDPGRWLLLNPRTILCVSSYPGPAEIPTRAIRARLKKES